MTNCDDLQVPYYQWKYLKVMNYDKPTYQVANVYYLRTLTIDLLRLQSEEIWPKKYSHVPTPQSTQKFANREMHVKWSYMTNSDQSFDWSLYATSVFILTKLHKAIFGSLCLTVPHDKDCPLRSQQSPSVSPVRSVRPARWTANIRHLVCAKVEVLNSWDSGMLLFWLVTSSSG